MNLWTFALVGILILINALYVAAEFALVGARATRVEQLTRQGRRLAASVLPILRSTALLDRYIAACQIGITLSSLVLGAFGQATIGLALGALLIAQAGMEPLGAYALATTLTLVVLTSLQVVLGELIPKTLALQYPVGTALLTHLPLRWSVKLFSPFIALLNGSGSLVLRWVGAPGEASHRHVHSPEEIDLLIRESRDVGLLEQQESERLREALQLGQHRVAQLMVPRRQIAGFDLNTSPAQLLAQIEASPYTRLVAYQGDIEQARGYLHVKDVAVALAAGNDLSDVRPLVRPLLALPSTLTIDHALAQLRDQRARIALLVDEYGEVEGLISLEDIIRELIGGISDEFKAVSAFNPLQLPDGRWRLPGRLARDEACEWVRSVGGPACAPSEANTLGGWLVEQLDAIPEGSCCLRTSGLEFEVEALKGRAIESVLVRLMPADEGEHDV